MLKSCVSFIDSFLEIYLFKESNMRKNLNFLLSILLAATFLSVSVFAQEQYGEIKGTVKDPQGAVVPNASITITGVTVGFKRTVTSDSDGIYSVSQVPPGTYKVTVAALSGFSEKTLSNVQVSLGNTTSVDFSLTIASSVGDVTITTDSEASVDTTESKIQTSVSAAKIDLLPKGVDFTSVLRTAPGTRSEGNAGGFSVDGASGSENTFIIDGQEVTNFRTGTLNGNNAIPTQFVQEVQVKSSGFEAEFGGATGGVINVVTKGGSNQFRGEFGTQFTSNKLNGNPRPALLRFTSGTGAAFRQPTEYFTPKRADGHSFFPTFNLSGPIIKDKVWFFSSYSPQIFNTTVNTDFYTNAPAATRAYRFSEEYRLKDTFQYGFTRIDASPVDSLRLSGTFLWNPIIREGALPFGTASFGGVPPTVDFGGSIGRLTGNQLTDRQGGRQTANNVTGQAVWTPTSNIVISGRYSRGFLNEKLTSYFVPSATRYICQAADPANPNSCPAGLVDAANTNIVKDVSIRTNYEGDITFTGNFANMRHELKGGYQRFRILNDVDRGYVGPGRIDLYYGFTIADLTDGRVTPTPGAVGAGELIRVGTVGKGQNTNQSIYVQDKVTLFNRLTLTAGVRFEKEDLPAFNSFAPPINFGWGDKIAPRFGFSFDVTGKGTTKIFGNYGRFNDRLKFELPRGSFGGDFFRQDYFEIFAGSNFRTAFTPASVLGNFNDAPGGRCPATGFIGSGLSRCQDDFRIASNNPAATIFDGKVDPDIKPFRQSEYTIGFSHQISRDYSFSSRFSYKNVDSAIEDAGIRNNAGSEAYIIGNPGSGLHLSTLKSLGYSKAATPERKYKGIDFVLNKRLSNNYYFNANYTYSQLNGNYSGLASSDEAGRTSPGVNRFFDLPFIGFTAAGTPDNGRLATDRPHVINAYGAYIFDWFGQKNNTTELGFFQTFQSGTPVTTTITWVTTTIFTKRGDLGRTPRLSATDFTASHKYKFGRDNRFTMAFDLNILNLWDQKAVTSIAGQLSAVSLGPATFGLNEVDGTNAYVSGALLTQINTYLNGTATILNRKNSTYGLANGYQGPRGVRFGFRLLF
jgi:outer membrane receptor protein involved in Fe transport